MSLGWYLLGFLSGVVVYHLLPGLRPAIGEEILPAIWAGFRKLWGRIFKGN